FGGTPLLGQMQGGVFYPPNLLLLLVRPEWLAYGHSILLQYALAGLFMFRYLRSLRLSRGAGVLGAIVFAFSGFALSHLGHVSTLRTVPWLPLMLAGFEEWRQRGALRHLALGALATGLMLMAGHPQIPLYALLVLVSYGAVLGATAPHPAERRRCFAGAPALVGGGGLPAAVQLLPTACLRPEYLRPDAGAYEYFATFSLPPDRLLNLLFPHLLPSDLSEQTGYAGIAPLALALMGAAAAIRERSR